MKAIILAAGKATRMRPFSNTKPKALVRLANIPLLTHTFNALAHVKSKDNQYITGIILITGYKEGMIKDYYKDQFTTNNKDNPTIKLSYVTQHQQLGTGHAALQAKPFILSNDKQILIINGDDIYAKEDLQKLTNFPNTILLQEKENVSAFGVVTTNQKTNQVTGFVEKPQGVPPSKLVNTGAYSFTPEVFSLLENLKESPRGEYELTDAVKALANQGQMHAQTTTNFWSPVGYPWNIFDATKVLLEQRHKCDILPYGTVAAGAIVDDEVSIDKFSTIHKGTRITGQVAIGKNVTIKENCTISGTVAIASGTTIGPNTIITDSIIGKNTLVKENCHIHDSIIGDNVTIHEETKTQSISPDNTIITTVKNKPFDTKRHKLGAIVADNQTISKSTIASPGQMIQ